MADSEMDRVTILMATTLLSPCDPATMATRETIRIELIAGKGDRQKVIAVKIDFELFKQACAYAKRKKLTLAQVIERGIRRELAAQNS